MSNEYSVRPSLDELEILNEDQEHLSRELFTHQFRVRYLYFQELMEASILFQTNLVRDKGEYAIIFPYKEVSYIVPYESLDAAFVDAFQKDLEDPDQKPINFRQNVVINRLAPDTPDSLRDYFGRQVETMETVYWLKPIGGKKRAIWQTTYLDENTGVPIAERWEGVFGGQVENRLQRNLRRIK